MENTNWTINVLVKDRTFSSLIYIECNFNCQTCSETSTYCLSCPIDHILLSDNTCQKCEDGKYADNNQCLGILNDTYFLLFFFLECDSSCKTCSISSKSCFSCQDGKYVSNKQCFSKKTIENMLPIVNALVRKYYADSLNNIFL